MQAAVVWRVPLSRGYALTLAGAPVGEPALGPIAFMHRASAFENPTAPLGHHTLDSTHIAMGVLTAGLDRGAWEVEGSVFHGAEPDEQRWDVMDPGALDSWSVRGWYRPGTRWTFQVSHGFLTNPESHRSRQPAAHNSIRFLDRASRFSGWTAVTAAYGPQQRARARLHRVARRSHARLRRHDRSTDGPSGSIARRTCCASASTSSSATPKRTCPKASAA